MTSGKRRTRVQPVRRNRALDAYAGQWVAVKDGAVIAHSRESRDVVRQLRSKGAEAKGAVLQRVATSAEPLAIGMG